MDNKTKMYCLIRWSVLLRRTVSLSLALRDFLSKQMRNGTGKLWSTIEETMGRENRLNATWHHALPHLYDSCTLYIIYPVG